MLPWIAISLYLYTIYDEYIEEANETKMLAVFVIISIIISNTIVFYAIFAW